MPSTISSSVTASIAPPVRRARSSANTPSAGLPIASDFAIVSGLDRPADVLALARMPARRASSPSACAPLKVGSSPSMMPSSSHSSKPRAIRVKSEPEATGHDHAVGQLEPELLGDLEAERLRPLGVVGAEVHVHERPRVLGGKLGAEAVDVVVVAVDRDQAGCRTRRSRGSSAPRGRPARTRMSRGPPPRRGRRPRSRGCPSRRTRHVVAELLGLRDRDVHDPVLEGVGRVGGVVLDVDLAHAEPLGEPLGADQRREAGVERGLGPAREGQEVGVAPDRRRAGLDLAAQRRRVVERRVVVARPRAVRSTARRRSCARARMSSGTPYISVLLRASLSP